MNGLNGKLWREQTQVTFNADSYMWNEFRIDATIFDLNNPHPNKSFPTTLLLSHTL